MNANSVHVYAFFLVIAVCCLHVFTRNTPYRSNNPFKKMPKPGKAPVANSTGDVI